MKQTMIVLAVLAAASFGAQPGYSQYASYVGVPGATYSSYYGGGFYGGAPVYGAYTGGMYGNYGGYGFGGYGGYGGYNAAPLMNSYAGGFGAFAPNVMSIASPGMVAPDVLVISRGGYGTYVGTAAVAAPMAAPYFGNPLPFVADSFMGSIDSFRPWAMYSRFNPY